MLKNNILYDIISFFNSKKNYLKINNNNIYVSTKNFNLKNFFFIDLYSFNNNNIVNTSYVIADKKNITWTLSLINVSNLKSLYCIKNCIVWYERELNENYTLKIIKTVDERNLLLPYNNKLLINNFTLKQKYNWIHTSLLKKNIIIKNRLKIIL